MVGSEDKVSDRNLVKDSVGPVFDVTAANSKDCFGNGFILYEHRARAQEKQVNKDDEDVDIIDTTELE
jgi:hypothetical protein